MTESPEPQPERKEDPIIVPGYGLLEDATKLVPKISALIQEAQDISVANPIRGYLQYRKVMQKRVELRPVVNLALGQCITALSRPVQNANLTNAGYFQAWSVGQSLAALNYQQVHWQALGGILDTKAAFIVATASMWLSGIALFVSLIQLWL